jgi:3-hydroxybutyryl-CoA dehydrogenase
MPHKIVIIGTGIMGAGIAASFLSEGAEVVILGRDLEKAKTCVNKAGELAAGLGPSGASSFNAVTPEIKTQAGLIGKWSDWSGVSLVIETVSEILEVKQAIFAWLDQAVPADIPIGSNASGFPISRIAKGLCSAERMINTHYFMPAELVPLVEVVLGEFTNPAVGQKVMSLYRDLRKKPVLVRKDIPGFLANRMQHALMREALTLIDSGIVSAEDVDDAVRYSFGFRYAAVGPITQKEISGWDGMANAAKEIFPSLSNTPNLPQGLAQRMSEGKTGMKAGEGYRRWTPEEIQDTRRRYNERLKAALAVLHMD